MDEQATAEQIVDRFKGRDLGDEQPEPKPLTLLDVSVECYRQEMEKYYGRSNRNG